jgi:hypothetical protein
MRHSALLALLCAAALVALALVFVPSCDAPLIHQPLDSHQHEELRHRARLTVRKFRERHGDTPMSAWPELDQQTYRNANRILMEMSEGEADDEP